MSKGKVICIIGIDTDIGKSFVTGLMGRYLLGQGYKVITQKICQTGCVGMSEDILTHRKMMGIPLTKDDTDGLTCSYVFSEPCSPHLAASLENTSIDLEKITNATERLIERYDIVLLEGVGGLMVPLQLEHTLVEYLAAFNYHHFLVSSPRLGSLNHTISALEILQNRNIQLQGVIYNRFEETSEVITIDTKKTISKYLLKYGHVDKIMDVFGSDEKAEIAIPDFTEMFKTVLQCQ
jgi:dethiobiotin synthetase